MSAGVLFGMGAFVTIVVAIGLALPIYGAILDGRYEKEQRLAQVRELPKRVNGTPTHTRQPAA